MKSERCHVSGNKGWVSGWRLTNRVLKSGKISKHEMEFYSNSFTPLNTCGMCGKVSTPKRVQYRHLCSNYNNEWYQVITSKEDKRNAWMGRDSRKSTLCMGCWNKAVRVIEKEDRLQDNIKLLKQLTTVIYHERKKLINNSI